MASVDGALEEVSRSMVENNAHHNQDNEYSPIFLGIDEKSLLAEMARGSGQRG